MKRTIKFKGFVGRWDVPSFIVCENDTLKFCLAINETLKGIHYLTIKIGDYTTRLLYEGQEIVLYPNVLEHGDAVELYLELRTNDADRVVIPSAKTPIEKGYFVEPLRLVKTKEQVSATGWFAAIEERLSAIDRVQETINARLDDIDNNGVPLQFEDEEI